MPKTHQSIDVVASISEVWARFSDFHDLSWAPNVINNVEKEGGVPGGEVGAKRVLNNAFHKTLVEIDNDRFMLSFP